MSDRVSEWIEMSINHPPTESESAAATGILRRLGNILGCLRLQLQVAQFKIRRFLSASCFFLPLAHALAAQRNCTAQLVCSPQPSSSWTRSIVSLVEPVNNNLLHHLYTGPEVVVTVQPGYLVPLRLRRWTPMEGPTRRAPSCANSWQKWYVGTKCCSHRDEG